jgi:hypothetical protein
LLLLLLLLLLMFDPKCRCDEYHRPRTVLWAQLDEGVE